MARLGRDFELLVARLEEWLGPLGAIIKSPDSLIDMTTKGVREVDASIRTKVGSTEVLLIIECRDRSHVQDVTWIEQLPTKKAAVGADKVVAVSSSGFTANAIEKAKQLGIETRVISEITTKEALDWVNKTRVTLMILRWNVRSIGLVVGKEHFPLEVSPEVIKEGETVPSDTVLGHEKLTGIPITVRSIMDRIVHSQRDIFKDVFESHSVKARTIRFEFPKGEFEFRMSNGSVDAKEVLLTLDLWPEFATPNFKVLEYRNPDSTVLRIGRARYEMEPGRQLDMLFSETKPSDWNPRANDFPGKPEYDYEIASTETYGRSGGEETELADTARPIR